MQQASTNTVNVSDDSFPTEKQLSRMFKFFRTEVCRVLQNICLIGLDYRILAQWTEF